MNKIFTKFYSNNELPFFSLRYSNSNKHYKKHFHNTFSLGVNKEGISIYTNQNKKFILEKNKLSVMNPYELHSCNASSIILNKYYMMHLDPSWCVKIQKQINKDITEFQNINTALLKNKEIYNSFIDLCDFIFGENSIEEIENELISFYIDFFALFIDENNENIQNEDFEKIKTYINKNYKENLSLSFLSSHFSLNEFYLIRLFKKHLGTTPQAYIINLKIEKSKEYLQKGFSIIDTALEHGFYDQSHFHRNFIKFTALTPKEYQKSLVF